MGGRPAQQSDTEGEVNRCHTTLPVQDQFSLKFFVLIQGLSDLLADQLTGVWPIEEGAGTASLHDLSSGETREVTEAIRAVDHREEPRHLGVAQHEVTVCKRTRGAPSPAGFAFQNTCKPTKGWVFIPKECYVRWSRPVLE